MELSSCQGERRWKLLSLRPHSDPGSGRGLLDFSVVRNHRTVVRGVHSHLEVFLSLLPVALQLQLSLPIGLCRRMPDFFTSTTLEFLDERLGMDPVARQHLLWEIMDARDSVVRGRGFYIAVHLEVATVSFEDDTDLQPHRPCGASEAARRKLHAESFVPAAADQEVGTCAICLGDLSSGRRGNKRRLTKMPCTHLFHYRCISRWLDTSNTLLLSTSLALQFIVASVLFVGEFELV